MKELIANLEKIAEIFIKTCNYVEFERAIKELVDKIISVFIHSTLQDVLNSDSYLSVVKQKAGKCCLSYQGHRFVSVNIWNGEHILVSSPYFYSCTEKRKGRKKKGRKKGNNIDGHFGLSKMGFISRYSPGLVDDICKTSVLAPSQEMAVELLSQKGIEINIKTLRKVCRDVFNIITNNRGKYCFSRTSDEFSGLTLVIGIDGGRIRIRKNKSGRKKKDQKRHSYHTDWKEPKLLSMYFIDSDGKKVKDIKPVYDATMQGMESMTNLLEAYLNSLPDYYQIDQIVFTADGAPWIWTQIENIIKRCLSEDVKIYQVLDYTHAKQAMGEIFELFSKKFKQKEKLWENACGMLWNGEIDEIKSLIDVNLKGNNKLKAQKKWSNYFDKNRKRMQYEKFSKLNIPCGSGGVESAIRRVINMRLKSAGSFWLQQWAEVFLFIRAQIISGRWPHVMENLINRLSDDNVKTTKTYIKTNDYMKMAA